MTVYGPLESQANKGAAGGYAALDETGNVVSSQLGSAVTTLATAGHPTSGTWKTGQSVVDSNGVTWNCTAGGTPGTWAQSALVPSNNLSDVASAPTALAHLGGLPESGGTMTGLLLLKSGPVIELKAFGAAGNGSTDDSTAITNWLTAVATANGKASAAPGTYLTNPFTIPPGVRELFGAGRGVTTFLNKGTTGGVFISGPSQLTISHLTILGQRANNTGGLAGLQFNQINNPVYGGTNVAGGMILASSPSAGATSLTVTTLGPLVILPGDTITLVSGALIEQVRVASTYTGGTTIPLTDPLVNTYPTTAFVTLAVSQLLVADCEVHSNGRDGIALWHAIDSTVESNWVYDCSDTAIDMPSAGSQANVIHGNHIDTNGQWGVSLDSVSADITTFGNVEANIVENNTVRFKGGGSTAPTDGVYIGQTVSSKIRGNVFDLTAAGISGVNLVGNTGHVDSEVTGNTVIGPATPRSGTTGIRCTNDSGWAGRPKIIGNTVRNMANGIDLDVSLGATVIGNGVYDVSGYGITALAGSSGAQKHTVADNICDTNVAAIRFGGTPPAGSMMEVQNNVLTNSSYAPIIADSPQFLHRLNNPGVDPQGLGGPPAIPASGTPLLNPYSSDCDVFISGGTVTAVEINGTGLGVTSGYVSVCCGQSITLVYSAAPSWIWFLR